MIKDIIIGGGLFSLFTGLLLLVGLAVGLTPEGWLPYLAYAIVYGLFTIVIGGCTNTVDENTGCRMRLP